MSHDHLIQLNWNHDKCYCCLEFAWSYLFYWLDSCCDCDPAQIDRCEKLQIKEHCVYGSIEILLTVKGNFPHHKLLHSIFLYAASLEAYLGSTCINQVWPCMAVDSPSHSDDKNIKCYIALLHCTGVCTYIMYYCIKSDR